MLLLAAGCAVDVNVLLQEIDLLKIDRDRIIVDPRAVLVEDVDRNNEIEASIRTLGKDFLPGQQDLF